MPYQYVTVAMPLVANAADKEKVWTDRLNAVAADGWRLVTISSEPRKGDYSAHWATFEREAS